MASFRRVASVKDIPEGGGKSLRVDGKEIAVFNLGGEFHAIGDICPHMGGPLGEGTVDGENVICPWHGWTFCIKTGNFAAHPGSGVDGYPVKVEGEDIYVEF